MSQQETGARPSGQSPSEEELRAQLESELKRLRVDDVILQSVVSLLNLGARRAGLAGAGDDEVDLGQVESAIEAVQALLSLLDKRVRSTDLRGLRDALAQLQLAYARRRGTAPPAAAQPSPGEAREGGEQPRRDQPEGPGPAESSGRLWVPGR
jgi:hypothetical protein